MTDLVINTAGIQVPATSTNIWILDEINDKKLYTNVRSISKDLIGKNK